MIFKTAGHFSGLTTNDINLTIQLPWLYIIAAQREKFLYIGETFDEEGLIVRLGRHFGRFQESTFRQTASKFGILKLLPPFFVVAARLPYGADGSPFDCSSKKIRLMVESTLHQIFVSKFAASKGWTIISTFNVSSVSDEISFQETCQSIFKNFETDFSFFEPLTKKSPFHLILLEPGNEEAKEKENIGELIEKVEVQLFGWVLDILKKEYDDDWWKKGIPENIRIQCQTRKEQENRYDTIPPEGYLTLIDFRDIVKRNWKFCDEAMQYIGEQQGKDRGTAWIVELNEMRKLWAHPIKQKFVPIKPIDIEKIVNICKRINDSFSQ